MFPDSTKDSRLTWAKFKEIHFPQILENQDKANGGWSRGYIGPIFVTSVNLTILQLDKGILPLPTVISRKCRRAGLCRPCSPSRCLESQNCTFDATSPFRNAYL